MYKHYYLNKETKNNPNHNHEVHTEDCRYLPSVENRVYLGLFSSCEEAVKKAQNLYSNVDGCLHCCPQCHKERRCSIYD